jgi:hypothetical protein
MDNIMLAIQSILQTNLGSGYRVIYGDDIPGLTEFPYIAVENVNTTYVRTGTGGLAQNTSVIQITAKVNLKDFMQDNTDVTIQAHRQELIKIMEERETNGVPKTSSVLGALYQDLSLGGIVSTIQIGTIQYDTSNAEGSYIRTATLNIETTQQLPFCTS